MCFLVTFWEKADLLALICGVLLWACHFPIGILGQVWYLIVSIPDLCTLTYFDQKKKIGFETVPVDPSHVRGEGLKTQGRLTCKWG